MNGPSRCHFEIGPGGCIWVILFAVIVIVMIVHGVLHLLLGIA